MITELHVRDLGVIEDVTLVLGPGMTAITGETGAGKTLLVEAIELLTGARADPVLVRPGAAEAVVEGRLEVPPDGREVVLCRVVAAAGRSRAYVDGRMAAVSALAGVTREVVDLHGQHSHQSLLSPAGQRAALDSFAGVDLGPLRTARARLAAVDAALGELGGDDRARLREVELLRFQVEEIDAAGVSGDDEDDELAVEEERLEQASSHREAAAAAGDALGADGAAVDQIAGWAARLAAHPPLAAVAQRLKGLAAEATDAVGDLRTLAESLVDDPERLEAVRQRRRALGDLRRKYGDTLADVRVFADEARGRLSELASRDERARALTAERESAVAEVTAAARVVADARRAAAPRLAAAVETRLRSLAMVGARLEVDVDGPAPADNVTFLLAANAGGPPLPLAKVASGGELARTMLASRLEIVAGPPVLVFDEVDAGIGGEAAVAVADALAALAGQHQVFVVTHLPQVAAAADHHVAVRKQTVGGTTRTVVTTLGDEDRVVEISRMLSGRPDSRTARGHAAELLSARRPVGP
ncbi:MAG TPA: DNA repair protein RecN [Acidimicrobiales bacterium]|nr:DNA repair protein RecN [Acidimicrobiales bacterium]